jgi:hypothetical protein
VGAGLYPPPKGVAAKGIVAFVPLVTSGYVGDTETRAYAITWTAEAGRAYMIRFMAAIVDADGVGDQTTYRYAKQAAMTSCRWATGSGTATVTSTSLGYTQTTVYDDDSLTGNGVFAEWVLSDPPAGPVSAAICTRAMRAAATYGSVRYITGPTGLSHLIVEDIGPAF